MESLRQNANLISTQEPEFWGRSCMAVMKVTRARSAYRRTVSPWTSPPLNCVLRKKTPCATILPVLGWFRAQRPNVSLSRRSHQTRYYRPIGNGLSATGGVVTIVLGMRDYGRGCFSAYFANLVTVRLGIPFRRIRVYYSANLPAVLQTPVRSLIVSRRSNISPVAEAAAHVIEQMCDQAIEKGRSAFAAISRVSAIDVGFDQPTGRFLVLDRHRSCGVLEIAERARNGSYSRPNSPMKLRRTDALDLDELC
jgi:hypothetical protein